MRQVEVPYTRKVKVPVQTKSVVKENVTRQVPVKRMQRVKEQRTINEEYVDYEDHEVVREKEVWVKKIVPERVVERVAVTRTRPKVVSEEVLREVEVLEDVTVPEERVIVVDGFRVDEIEDTRLVEVEEEEEYELQPVAIGSRVKDTRDLGLRGSQRLARHRGNAVYAASEVESIDDDSDSDDERDASYLKNSLRLDHRARSAHPSARRSTTMTTTRVHHDEYVYSHRPSTSRSFATAERAMSRSGYMTERTFGKTIGIQVLRTDTKGCRVTKVRYDKPGFHAGVRVGDVIMTVNGRPVNNAQEFRDAVANADRKFTVEIKRGGSLTTSVITRQ